MSISVQGLVPLEEDEKALTGTVKSIISSTDSKFTLQEISAIPNTSSALLTYSGKTPQEIDSKYLGNNYTIDSVGLTIDDGGLNNDGQPFKFKPVVDNKYMGKILTTPGYGTKEYTFEVPLDDLKENSSYRIKMSLHQSFLQSLYSSLHIFGHCTKKFSVNALINLSGFYACLNSDYFSQNYNPMLSIEVRNNDLIKKFLENEEAKWRVSSIKEKFLPLRESWDEKCLSDYRGDYIAECRQRHEVFISAFINTSKKHIFTESFYDRSSDNSMVLDKHIINLYKAFDSLQCESGIVNQLQEEKIIENKEASYSNYSKFAKDLCKYNKYTFIRNKVEAYPKQYDNEFVPYSSCDGYICEFQLSREQSYSVVVSLVKGHPEASKEWENIFLLEHGGESKCIASAYCEIKLLDKYTIEDKLISMMSLMNNTKDSKYAVVEKQRLRNVKKETEKIILNQMPDNHYRVEVILHDSNKILKLTDNTYKTFYWSGSDKYSYYKYDPRFVDSRYAFVFYATDYHHDIFRGLQDHKNTSYYINLHPDYKNVLNCYSDFPDANSWCGGGNPRTIDNKSAVYGTVKADTKADHIIASGSTDTDDEYCRVPQKGSDKDLKLPFNKPSESTFVKKMNRHGFNVSCMTFGHRPYYENTIKKIRVKQMVMKIEEQIDIPVLYAVDCDPQDKSVKVMRNKEFCSMHSNHSDAMTLFLAIPKSIDAVIPATTLMEFQVDFGNGPSKSYEPHNWYSDLPPWGNLNNNVRLNHDSMLVSDTRSLIDRIELDTTEMKSMDHMFAGTSTIYKGNFKYWDTSKVTDMKYLFDNMSWHKDSIDISNWDTSNVTDMSEMFAEQRRFNQDITSWDISKVEKASCMFTSYSEDRRWKHIEDVQEEKLINKFWDVKEKEFTKKGFARDDVICEE